MTEFSAETPATMGSVGMTSCSMHSMPGRRWRGGRRVLRNEEKAPVLRAQGEGDGVGKQLHLLFFCVPRRICFLSTPPTTLATQMHTGEGNGGRHSRRSALLVRARLWCFPLSPVDRRSVWYCSRSHSRRLPPPARPTPASNPPSSAFPRRLAPRKTTSRFAPPFASTTSPRFVRRDHTAERTQYTPTSTHTERHAHPAMLEVNTRPQLSTRGKRALVRPPLLRCALFENQFSHSTPQGLINLGVAENVRPRRFSLKPLSHRRASTVSHGRVAHRLLQGALPARLLGLDVRHCPRRVAQTLRSSSTPLYDAVPLSHSRPEGPRYRRYVLDHQLDMQCC
jgi:hypothetical protein